MGYPHKRKAVNGINIVEDDLTDSIKDMLSKDAWEQIGDVKIKRKRKTPKLKQVEKSPATVPAPQAILNEIPVIGDSTINPIG